MIKKIVYFLLILSVSSIISGQQGINIEQNIENVKKRLGDKLLTTADQVIEKYIQAIGGREALMSIKTLMVRGRNARFGEGDLPLYRIFKSPGYFKAMRSLADNSYTVSDGKTTWTVSKDGKKELSGWVGESLKHQRIDGNFIDYSEQGIKYEYLGLRGFATEPNVYYHLRRTYKDGYIEELDFDVNTGLLHCLWNISSPIKNSSQVFYDYRKTGGILFPYMWMRVHDHTAPPHLFVIEEIKINENYSDDFFN